MPEHLPQAEIVRERRLSWAWLVPAAALIIAGWLVYAALAARGTIVTVELGDGYGLRVGDEVRYRGIAVGEVRAIDLAADGNSVVVTAGLVTRSDRLRRAGAQYWVVRPQLRLSGAEGLETLVGPRYLSVEPGPAAAPIQRRFVGLVEPPVVARTLPGDLEVVLESRRRGSLRPGAPVTYRQVRVGTVRSVGLALDGGGVETRLHVAAPYAALVREGTRFWDAGGVRTTLSLSGLSVEVESLLDLVVGGVAFATPPPDQAGTEVLTGHRFGLAAEPQDAWLAWTPSVPIGSELLPPGAIVPHPLRATVGWRQGFLVKGRRSRHGWVLQLAQGLVGPADLLSGTPTERAEGVDLAVAGTRVPIGDNARDAGPGLARLVDTHVSPAMWPQTLVREMTTAEDCIVVADPADSPLPLAAARLTSQGGSVWTVDASISIDPRWHGACVVSRGDGAVVGLLLVTEEAARVSPVRLE